MVESDISRRLKASLPETQGQWFLYLFLGGMVLLYLASEAISGQLGQDVSVGPFMFVVIMGVAIWVLVFMANSVMRQRVISGEQWVTLGLVAGAIVALFYFFPGIIPDSFSAAMTEIHSMVGGP